MADEQSRCLLSIFCRRIVIVLVLTAIIGGTWLLENEDKLKRPHPRALALVFKRIEKPSASIPPPFNYSRTNEWGKQDKAAWSKFYGDFSCPENHRRRTMISILRTWLKLVNEYKIEYAFYFGSLLGIVRNNDVNPWDHDMDVLIPYQDILKLEKVGWPRTNPRVMDRGTFINYIPNSQHNVSIDDRKRWDCDGKLAARHVDKCSIQEPLVRLYKMGVFLDVFSYWTTNNTLEFVTEGRHHIIKKRDYFPLRKCSFMGFDTWCPNNPDILLRMSYGNNYITPIKICKNGHWI